jgi:RNA polymerase sigma-70 factor (ECF subfamily)
MTTMDHEEFGRLYKNQFNCVYRYSLAITGNHAHAEEITQEAFARLLRNGFDSRAVVRPEAWLMRVARNLAIESIRERSRNSGSLPSAAPDSPEHSMYRSEILQRILQALSKLAETQRECISLREFGELRYQEIADLLGTSVDQVKVQLFRARRHLKRELEDLT